MIDPSKGGRRVLETNTFDLYLDQYHQMVIPNIIRLVRPKAILEDIYGQSLKAVAIQRKSLD